MIPNFGPMEIALVVGLALIVFGPARLPSLGRSLGKGISGFRKEVSQLELAPEQGAGDEASVEDESETARKPI